MTKLAPFLAFIVFCSSFAGCVKTHKIKTHPEPEERIEKMQQTLKLLKNEDVEQAEDQKKKGMRMI